MVGNLLRAVVGHVVNGNTKLTRSNDIYRVKANTVANECPTALQSCHARYSDWRVVPDDHRPGLADLVREVRVALAKKPPHFGCVADDR